MENSEFIPSGGYGKAESSDRVPNLWDKSGMNKVYNTTEVTPSF